MATKYHYELHNLDGQGMRKRRVYLMPADHLDYWAAVTDATCPVCQVGTIQWAEAGYVPGYRICDGCHRHFLAKGDIKKPKLVYTGRKRRF